MLIIVMLSSFLILAGAVNSTDTENVYRQRRLDMVEEQMAQRDISTPEVLRAMRAVPRHKFVPEHLMDLAYSDTPLPIGMGQTISQPYIVAYMTELIRPGKGRKVLEIGTGSGYQAAVLAEMGAEVYTVEILEPLSLFARSVINGLGYSNVHFKTGDGYLGWEEHAPYDAVIVTAAPEEIPEPLKAQLREGGRMVIPVADDGQELLLLTKTKEGFDEERVAPVMFVPMTGEAEKHRKSETTKTPDGASRS
ncbi:MAG: protein-L-isoaspartate(D-aspartate) O-methyltransferase [Thermodesulfobacteriota bacterium]